MSNQKGGWGVTKKFGDHSLKAHAFGGPGITISPSHTIYIHKEHKLSVEQAQECGEPIPMHRTFLKLDPEARAKHLYEPMCFTKWPAGIKSTHFWKFEWNDDRRREKGSVWSNDGWCASAIKVKAEGKPLLNSPMIKAVNVNQHK